MKKTPVAEMGSADYSFDFTYGGHTLKWEDPRKMLAKPPKVISPLMSPESMAQRAIKHRVISRLPKAGMRYMFQAVETQYDLAKDTTKVFVSMVDTHTFTEWAYTFEVDMYSLAIATPGDWRALDKHVDIAVEEVIAAAAKAMAVTKPKLQENDDVPNQTQWTYVEKPRNLPIVRTSTSGSAEVYSLEDVPS